MLIGNLTLAEVPLFVPELGGQWIEESNNSLALYILSTAWGMSLEMSLRGPHFLTIQKNTLPLKKALRLYNSYNLCNLARPHMWASAGPWPNSWFSKNRESLMVLGFNFVCKWFPSRKTDWFSAMQNGEVDLLLDWTGVDQWPVWGGVSVENPSVWAAVFSVFSIIQGTIMANPLLSFLLWGYTIAMIMPI